MSRLASVRTLLTQPTGQTVALVFATLSVVGANWISRIPEIQARLHLNESDLGLGLLGMPLGSVAVMFVVGRFVARFGAARTTLWSTYAYCLAIVGPALASSLPEFFCAMVVIGFTSGAMDVAMNDVAARVEERIGRPVMSACHGFFSLGGMIGAAAGALMAEIGVPLLPHLAGAGLVMIVLVIFRRRTLLYPSVHVVRTEPTEAPETAQSASPNALPRIGRASLFGLAATALIILIGEGAMADWSAVFLVSVLGTSPGFAGLGYAVFSLLMAVGRFLGDEAVERWGSPAVVRAGSALAAGGLALALVLGHPGAALVGFGCVGLGYAAIIPVLFRTAAGTTTLLGGGTNLPIVAGAGYTGLLIGPPLIGFSAAVLGLTGALGIVVVLTAFAALFAPYLLRKNEQERAWALRPAA